MHTIQLSHLKSSLNKLQSLPLFTARLEQTGLLQTLAQTICQVFTNESRSISAADVRDHLTVLCGLLITESWQSCEVANGSPGKTASTSDTSRGLGTERAEIAEISARSTRSVVPKHTTLPTKQPTPVRKSLSQLQATSPKHTSTSLSHSQSQTDDLRSISDFSIPVPTTLFARAQRKTLEVHEVSPGPAHYRPDTNSTKPRSTEPIIPHSGKRFEFVVPDTPGPPHYTPVRSFLAKHGHTRSVA